MEDEKSKLPVIYIDIDGVLLANESSLADGAAEFIKYIADNFEVFWLTTHCMRGEAAWPAEYVNRASAEDLSPWLKKFKPTNWSLKKTDAIDMLKPFLWFDDDCFSGEKQDLLQNKVFNSWIEVDLRKYNDQLRHELKHLKSIVKELG